MPVGKYHFNDPRSERRRRVAIHEAGHAVIARKLGFVISRVSIANATTYVQGDGDCHRRDYDGRCEIAGVPVSLITDGALNYLGRVKAIVQMMAGFEAEVLICPSPAAELWRSDIGDLGQIARINNIGDPFDLNEIRECAREVVSINRTTIDQVAVELSRCGEINGSELDAIMGMLRRGRGRRHLRNRSAPVSE